MTRGRKPGGPALADKVDGSESARLRLRVILETMSGDLSVEDACKRLAISEAMFYKLRSQFLQDAVGLLEPRKPGRKKQEPDPAEAQVRELEAKVKELTLEVDIARVRTEIAVTMPHLLKKDVAKAKKNYRGKNHP